MPRVVSFRSPRVAEVVDESTRPLAPGEVRVRTLFSGISAGTELTAYRGSNPYLARRWDDELRLFVDGDSSLDYPLDGWGYEEVGEVVELGPTVEAPQPGTRIWGTWGHRSETIVTADYARARVLAADADPRIGMFSQIGGIALNVVLDADIHVGETVAVFGLGVPGQLVAQLARRNGARVIAVDGVASRRRLASELGAETTLDPADGEVAERIRSLTDGRGADVCLEVTGNYGALHEAIRSVAYSSRVCVAGFMQGEGVGLRLGEEFHHNRVQVTASQISGVAPALQHRWDRMRLDRTAIELAASGRIAVTELISHSFDLENASDAFELLDRSPQDVLQVVLEVSRVSYRLAAQEWMLEGETLEQKFAFATAMGFDGIELGARGAGVFEGRAAELRHAREAGVVMPSAVVLPTSFLGDFDPDRRRDAITELNGFLRTLVAAGAQGIVTPNSFGVFSTKLPPFVPPRTDQESRAALVEALREAAAVAEERGRTVYLEPLNRYEDYLVNTLADATGVVDVVASRGVRVIADTFHMSIEEADIGAAIREAGDRIAHVQLGDSNRLEPGAGHYDWDETLTALEDIGYDGWLAMECGLSGPAAEVLPRVARLLKR